MWCIGRCVVVCVCKLCGSKVGEDESASALGETEGFVWKVSASCHQHA